MADSYDNLTYQTDTDLDSVKRSLFDSTSLDAISASFNIFSRAHVQKFDMFSQYGFYDIHDTSTYYKEYLFFTKPHLNINGLSDVSKEYAHLITTSYEKVLSYLTTGGKGFIPLLTNTVSLSNGADVPDSVPMDFDTHTNMYGAYLSYKGQSLESSYNPEFTLEFEDTRFLDVYMLFHIWDRYSTLKMLGYMMPLAQYLPPANILEDQISVYKIIVGDDLESIVYYGKYTGVYPKSLPRNVFTTLESGNIKLPVTFRAFMYEDMDPVILNEFNDVVNADNLKTNESLKSPTVGLGTGIDNSWKFGPYIEHGKMNGRPIYYLRWR